MKTPSPTPTRDFAGRATAALRAAARPTAAIPALVVLGKTYEDDAAASEFCTDLLRNHHRLEALWAMVAYGHHTIGATTSGEYAPVHEEVTIPLG